MSLSSRLRARERELGRPVVPAARRRAAELGVDLATVAGTGRAGVVRVADVEAAAGAVDSQEHVTSGSATLPHRGTAPGTGSVQAAPVAPVAPVVPVVPVVPVAGDAEVVAVPLSGLRRTVARRLVESMRSTPTSI